MNTESIKAALVPEHFAYEEPPTLCTVRKAIENNVRQNYRVEGVALASLVIRYLKRLQEAKNHAGKNGVS